MCVLYVYLCGCVHECGVAVVWGICFGGVRRNTMGSGSQIRLREKTKLRNLNQILGAMGSHGRA